MHELITSKANEKIKLAVRVRDSAKARREEGLFFTEGARLCVDAAGSVPVKTLFYTEKAAEKYRAEVAFLTEKSEEVYLVSGAAADRLSDTLSPQGIFCVCKTLDKSDNIGIIYSKSKLIALENIQDPANLGAVIRTAEALGIGGAVLCGCCDVYNPKAQRAAMGSLLRLPTATVDDLPQTLADFAERGFTTLASTPDASADDITKTDLGVKTICVIGNEGNGVTEPTAQSCARRVRVPMGGRAESLNASMAAAIIMWELMR